MNSDYIKEELSLLLKDELILDYRLIENVTNEENFESSEVKKIFITTLENNILEISINDSYCYKIDTINSKINFDKEKSKCLYEDLSNLIDNNSDNFRTKFNQILKDKLSNLMHNQEDD